MKYGHASPEPTTRRDAKRPLTLVPAPDNPEHIMFLQDAFQSEAAHNESPTPVGYMSDLEAATMETEELLLAAGLPVATLVVEHPQRG